MPKRKALPEKKVHNFSIGLRKEQIDWLERNKEFHVHEFVRSKLDEYIEQKKELTL